MGDGARARLPQPRPEATQNCALLDQRLAFVDGDGGLGLRPLPLESHCSPAFRVMWPKTPREPPRTTSAALPKRNVPVWRHSRHLLCVTQQPPTDTTKWQGGYRQRGRAGGSLATGHIVRKGRDKVSLSRVMISVCSLLPLTTFSPHDSAFCPSSPGAHPAPF